LEERIVIVEVSQIFLGSMAKPSYELFIVQKIIAVSVQPCGDNLAVSFSVLVM